MPDYVKDNTRLMHEWNYEKNKEIDINNITSGSSKKVWWKCDKGHEWQAVIHTRRDGVGCPYCAGKKAIKGLNDFAFLHPEMLKEWDYEKNEKMGITPNNVSKSYSKKVWWKCDKGHSYLREIYNQRKGYGKCPICRKEK